MVLSGQAVRYTIAILCKKIALSRYWPKQKCEYTIKIGLDSQGPRFSILDRLARLPCADTTPSTLLHWLSY